MTRNDRAGEACPKNAVADLLKPACGRVQRFIDVEIGIEAMFGSESEECVEALGRSRLMNAPSTPPSSFNWRHRSAKFSCWSTRSRDMSATACKSMRPRHASRSSANTCHEALSSGMTGVSRCVRMADVPC
jgi:hypothetical protein